MMENISEGERSFFGDTSFHKGETNKNNKEFSKNSSNPEKIYDKYYSEIKIVTENGKDSSYQSSNSNSKILERPPINERLFESKYWSSNNKEKNINPMQFTNNFKKLKKKLSGNKKENKIPFPKNDKIFETYSDIDEFDSEAMDENVSENSEIINNVFSIQIQSNNFNNNSTVDSSIVNKENNKIKCFTEPEEYYQNSNLKNVNMNNQELFSNQIGRYEQIGSFVSMNYPSLNKGSFISNYQNNNNIIIKENENNIINNKNENNNENKDLNEGIENSAINSYQTYCTEYRTRIRNSDIHESKFSNFPIMNLNMVYYSNIPSSNNIENNNNNQNNNNSNSKSIEKIIINNNNNNNINNKGSVNAFSFKKITKNHILKTEISKGEKQLINLEDIINGKDTRTTLMIRNIPIKYTDEKLIEELEEFKGKFDCVYMPYDFEKGGNKGYAFINLIHPFHILLFHEKFQNKSWTYFESKKICELNCANFQGKSDIQKHAKNYKGLKKPIFFNETDIANIPIEVPLKYLKKVKERFPKMSYVEKKNQDIFIIKSFED